MGKVKRIDVKLEHGRGVHLDLHCIPLFFSLDSLDSLSSWVVSERKGPDGGDNLLIVPPPAQVFWRRSSINVGKRGNRSSVVG